MSPATSVLSNPVEEFSVLPTSSFTFNTNDYACLSKVFSYHGFQDATSVFFFSFPCRPHFLFVTVKGLVLLWLNPLGLLSLLPPRWSYSIPWLEFSSPIFVPPLNFKLVYPIPSLTAVQDVPQPFKYRMSKSQFLVPLFPFPSPVFPILVSITIITQVDQTKTLK